MAAERSQLWEKAEACGEALRETAEIRAAMKVDPDLARFAGVVDGEAKAMPEAEAGAHIAGILLEAAVAAAASQAPEPRSAEIYTACARMGARAFRIAQAEAESAKARIAAKRAEMLAARPDLKSTN